MTRAGVKSARAGRIRFPERHDIRAYRDPHEIRPEVWNVGLSWIYNKHLKEVVRFRGAIDEWCGNGGKRFDVIVAKSPAA